MGVYDSEIKRDLELAIEMLSGVDSASSDSSDPEILKKEFEQYLRYCVPTTKRSGTDIHYGESAISSFLSYLNPNVIFGTITRLKDSIGWINSISSPSKMDDICKRLLEDVEFIKYDNDKSQWGSKTLVLYDSFLHARELFAKKTISSSKPALVACLDGLPLQQIFYGAPGTGKSKTVNDTTEQMDKENVFRVTFHPDSDYASFVGCYKPTKETVKLRDMNGKVIKETVDGKDVEVTEDRITYKFVPQAFTKAYVQAWKNWNSATKGVTAGIGVHCPAGNNVSPYSSISITGSRTFTANYQNEAELSDTEKGLLTMIDNLQFPYGRNTCFGELRDGLKVIVTDKPTPKQLESRKLTFTKEKLEELKKQIDFSKEEPRALSFGETSIEESLALFGEIINNLLVQAENGTITHTPDLLGLYCPGEKAIYLFKDNISSLSELVSTYVHEMFHAFYATENTIPEIEEPIVEASMLSFLESCKSADTQLETIFDDAKMHVQRKKYTLGIGYYGFGSYLHDNQSLDWMAQYKGNGFDRNSILVAEYRKQFDMQYPFGQEKETMELLWNILHGAKYATKDANSVMLVIEEINRGNCAQIFGDMFQLLDRNEEGLSDYAVKPDTDLEAYLKAELGDKYNENEGMRLPSNLYIWATMNTSDQSLFPIDSAFKRRWEWKYVPICKGVDKKSNTTLDWKVKISDDYELMNWWDFIGIVNKIIAKHTSSEDKQLGYFFCKPDEKANKDDAKNNVISAKRFVSKVLFYLWNDVFKELNLDVDCCKDENGEIMLLADFYDETGENIKVHNLVRFLKIVGETDASRELVREKDKGKE